MSNILEACAPTASRAIGVDAATTVAGALKSIADPLRLRMLSAIATDPRGEACVCDLAERAHVHPHVRSLLIGIEGEQEAETPFPKPLTDDAVRAADVVVTMGCGGACPSFPGKGYGDWMLEDPADQGIETVRPIRDEIKGRVEALLSELIER